jgi:hypothetical protein
VVGSEKMANAFPADEAAGNALPELLAVVEAAAVYRDVQKLVPKSLSSGDLKRAREGLDAALAVVAEQTKGTE